MIAGRAARALPLLAIAAMLLSPAASAQPKSAEKPATAPRSAQAQAPAPAPGAAAHGPGGDGFGQTGPNDHRPVDIQADQGIEWQQNNNVYIAHGNARATRGNATIYADTLIAHYRPAPSDAQQAGTQQAGGDLNTGSTQIYRVEADGNVRLETETQTVYGDHAIYDLDRATAVVTGKHLRLVTPRDTVTARDTLEWYDDKQIAVARGDAVAIGSDGRRLSADVLVAQVVRPPNEASRISRIDAQGHVLVSTTNEIARGASGVYNVDTGIATLAGNVTITRGDNELRGQYGVVDLNKNISRLLSAPPGTAQGGPVQGLIIPRQNEPGAAAAGTPSSGTPSSGAPSSGTPSPGAGPARRSGAGS